MESYERKRKHPIENQGDFERIRNNTRIQGIRENRRECGRIRKNTREYGKNSRECHGTRKNTKQYEKIQENSKQHERIQNVLDNLNEPEKIQMNPPESENN